MSTTVRGGYDASGSGRFRRAHVFFTPPTEACAHSLIVVKALYLSRSSVCMVYLRSVALTGA
ncbi:hypothetical protein [Actinocrinis sp.]|uniref:hypothetical protein n=1 Tax=Actinocrinis sp. TaxID=1920516 RepID=UPI002B72509C|nr:hypothetical protein [Actinocrinis sp.]HXR69995.1 hypothetical protein [Actinocrinis sp.]